MLHHASPPYKLVPVATTPPLLPAVVYSIANAGLLPPLAKRRRVGVRMGVGSAGPAVPWGRPACGYAQHHGQTSITARSLFRPVMGGVEFQQQVEGGQGASGVILDERQRQRRVVLQCVVKQQTAALHSCRPARLAEGTQVALFILSVACMLSVCTSQAIVCSYYVHNHTRLQCSHLGPIPRYGNTEAQHQPVFSLNKEAETQHTHTVHRSQMHDHIYVRLHIFFHASPSVHPLLCQISQGSNSCTWWALGHNALA